MIVELLERGDALDEMGMTRLYRHTTEGQGAVILSPDRSERSQAENKMHRKALLAHIRSMGKGYTHLKGGYIEQTPTGPRSVYEHSIMVHNVTPEEAEGLAKHAYEHLNRKQCCTFIRRRALT